MALVESKHCSIGSMFSAFTGDEAAISSV